MTEPNPDLLPEEDFSWRRMMAFGCVGLAFAVILWMPAAAIIWKLDKEIVTTTIWGMVGVIITVGGGYLGLPSIGEWQRRRSYTQIRTASITAGHGPRVDEPD